MFKLIKKRAAVWLAAGLFLGTAGLEAQSVSFAGKQTTLAGGSNYDVATDAAGNIYVSSWTAVTKIPADGSPRTTVGTGITEPRTVAVNKSGDIFIPDSGNGTVVKVPAHGGAQVTVAAGLLYPEDLAVNGAGDLFICDSGHNRILKVAADGSQSVVVSGLNSPAGITLNAAGDLYVADFSNYRLLHLPANGGPADTINTGMLIAPNDVAVDRAGNIFLATNYMAMGSTGWDAGIFKIPANGGPITMLTHGFSLQSVAVDGRGDLLYGDAQDNVAGEISYVIDFHSVNACAPGQAVQSSCSATLSLSFNVTAGGVLGSVQVLTDGNPQGDFSLASGSTCTGNVSAGSSCAVNVTFTPRAAGLRRGAVQITDASGNVLATAYISGTGTAGQLAFGSQAQSSLGSAWSDPKSAIRDGAGNLFAADDNGVWKIAANSTQTQIGSGFGRPAGLAVDGAGNLFVADAGNAAVYKITPAGVQTALGANWIQPNGIAADGTGSVFVADGGAHQIVEIQNDGSQFVFADGFAIPNAVALDGTGNSYVTDAGNSMVWKVDANGVKTSIGSGWNAPSGVAADASGAIYVADAGNQRVVRLGLNNTLETIGGGWGDPASVALSAEGDLLIADRSNNQVIGLNRSTPPALQFSTPMNGLPSGVQIVMVDNIGNRQVYSSSLNTTPGLGFEQAVGAAYPVQECAYKVTSAADQCAISFAFLPPAAQTYHDSAVMTTDAVNGTVTIPLTGVGVRLSQTITFTPVMGNGPLVFDPNVYVVIPVSASSALPIQLTSLTPAVCITGGNAVKVVTGGSCTIQATQAGDALYAAAKPVTQSFPVMGSQSISFGNFGTQTVGNIVQVPVTATSGLPVSLLSLSSKTCSVSGTTVTMLATGTCALQASQAGNAQTLPAQTLIKSFGVMP